MTFSFPWQLTPTRPTRSADRAAVRTYLATAACLVAVAWFAHRGPGRAIGDSHDFAAVYAASRAWSAGADPYAAASLTRAWAAAGGPADRSPSPRYNPSVYPPVTFPLLAPLAALPWPAACRVWCGVNLLSVAALILALCRLAGFDRRDPRALWLAAGVLLLRPTQSAVALGQFSLPAAALATIALLPVGTVVGNAIALALKFPVAGPFFAAGLFRRPVRATATLALLGAATVVILHRMPPTELSAWRANLAASAAPGHINDFSAANPDRHQLVDARYPLSMVVDVPKTAAWALALLCAAPAVVAVAGRRTGDLLPVATLAAAALLPIYHRSYDAVVLSAALAWALRPSTPWAQRGPTLALLFVLALPGSGGTRSPSVFAQAVAARDAWAVLGLAGWLAACQAAALRQRTHPLVRVRSNRGRPVFEAPGARRLTVTRRATEDDQCRVNAV